MSRAQTASWCRRRESNPYALKRAADFKSATSTNFVTPAIPYAYKKKGNFRSPLFKSGAGDESRTRDLNLGKVALYQLSYSRIEKRYFTDFKKYVKSLALKH